MRKLVFLFLLFPLATIAQQRLHLTVFGGLANYQGDLQSKQFTLSGSNLAVGLGAKYDLTAHFAVRAGFNFTRVEGSDRNNDPKLRFRNLSFISPVTEGNLMLEYTLFDMEEKRISPYAFAGVGVYHFNPYAYDTLGNKIYLQPLGTEGQGLSIYPDKEKYKLTQLNIPFGGGLKFRINHNTVLSYEVSFRKLFTDYLDDVSTTYADPFVLAQERGLKAVEMAYRAGELKDGDPNYPAAGTVRGGAKYKDWIYYTGFTLYIGLGSGNGGFGGKRGSQYGCPTPVY